MSKEIFLPKLAASPEDFDEIETNITEGMLQGLFLPIVELLPDHANKVFNSKNSLLLAIKSGRLQYYRGVFSGRFTSTLTRELRKCGAVWDAKLGVFRLPQSKLPLEIKQAISLSKAQFEKVAEKIDDKLSKIAPEKIADSIHLQEHFDAAIFKIENKFQKQIDGLTIAPQLSKGEREQVAREYSNDLKKHIVDFTNRQVKSLRDSVQEHVMSGKRYESLADEIESSFDVSKSKAKFLARQETNLMMASFTKARYQSAGLDEYDWKCVHGSPLHPVRPWHKRLDGTRQRFSNPPIVNEKGERKNPAEDYNCRCWARVVVKF